MAGDAARIRTVPVRLSRVAVRRLLVLGGLLVAGWLLGCAGHSAHADEVPPVPRPAGVVAKTPLLKAAVTTVHEREPVRRVVRAVAQKAKPGPHVRDASPPKPAVPPAQVAGHEVAPPSPRGIPAAKIHRRPVRPVVSAVSRARTSIGHGARHAVRHHRAPLPAPERPGTHSAAGAVVVPGATAGIPVTGTWAPAPPRAARPRVSGALPPAVRTAADEPSFAPD
ncbi:hypothetical protein [Spirillospora sp. CA-128828]|uniref:hypothetical protein n=1 Tax=Spirillospora sp. CA-128828 TaxID=3240033 RepID=UPI003D8AACBC